MNTTTLDQPRKAVNKAERKLRRGLQAEPSVTSKAPPLKKTRQLVALVNVGWGNSVFVRGEGANLSWDMGIPMSCVGTDRWVFNYPADDPPRTFKFLRNDTDWALGANLSTDEKEVSEYAPQFP